MSEKIKRYQETQRVLVRKAKSAQVLIDAAKRLGVNTRQDRERLLRELVLIFEGPCPPTEPESAPNSPTGTL